MAFCARELVIFGLIVTAICLVDGGPTRESGESNSNPDMVEIIDDQESGMLGRLWSSLGTLTGLKRRDTGERLDRFRRDLLTHWHKNMKTLTHASRRYRRSLETGATSAEGYWVLTDLDPSVNPWLKSYNAPSGMNSMVMFEHESKLFWITTSNTAINFQLLDVKSNTFEEKSVTSKGASKCKPVLKTPTFIEVVCAENLDDESRPGSSAYRVTWNPLNLTFVRSLPTKVAKDLATWKVGDNVFIAFANSFDSGLNSVSCVGDVFQLETAVTSKGTYTNYDKLDTAGFNVMNAHGLEAFKIMTRQFVAVANHMDDKGNVEVDSEIFMYDVHYSRMRPFQRIRTSAARAWSAFHFTNGENTEYFLAVANEYRTDAGGRKNYNIESVIYRFDDVNDKFLPFQCISTQGAYKWVTYSGPNGELLLGVVNSITGVALYQYNGWRFVRLNIPVSAPGVEWAWMGHLPNTLKKALFTLSANQANSRPVSYYMEFKYENPLGTYQNATAEWCSTYKTTMSNDGLSTLVVNVQQAPKTNESHTFTKPVHINGNLILPAGSTTSEVKDITVESDLKVDYKFHDDTRVLIDTRNSHEARLAAISTTISQSKSVNTPDLEGLHFAHLITTCTTPGCVASTVESLTAEKVNGVSASYDGIALLNNTDVKLNLTFEQVALAGSAEAHVVNIDADDTPVIPMNELVTLHKDHQITANVSFNKILADSIEVSGTIDSLTVDDATVLLTYGEQTVNGPVTVDGIKATMISTTDVNGRNFNDFINSLIVNGTTDTFEGTLEFGDDLIAPNINTVQAMSPLNPVDVAARALLHTSTTTQTVTGLHTIGSLETTEGVWFDDLNGVRVPDDIFLKDETVTVNIPTTFDTISAQQIEITKQINDVKQVNGDLEFLLKNKDATLSNKVFTYLKLEKDSTVAKQVAGYNLDYLATGLHNEFLQQLDSGRAVNGSVIFEKELLVTSDTVLGVSISKIRDTGVLLNATSLNTALTFEKPVQIAGALEVSSTINGVNKDDYLLLDGDHTIVSPKTFVSDVACHEEVVAGLVSGYDLPKFASDVVLKKGAAQTIVQDLSMTSADVNGHLTVAGSISIGGVDFNDVVTLNATETVMGKKTFTTVEVTSSTSAGAVDVGDFGTVDGVVIKEMFDDSLKKSETSTQEMVGRTMDSIVAQNAVGTDLSSFERKVVYKDTTETIAGALTLQGSVSVDSLNFESDLDGVSEVAYKSAWLLKEGPQTLTGSNTLGNVDASAVDFQGTLVDNVDIGRLNTMTAKLDEQTTLNAVACDEIESLSNIALDGTIQGWHLSEQAMQSSSVSQRVTGKKRFTKPVHISSSIDVDEFVIVPKSSGGSPLVLEMSQFCSSFLQQGKAMGDLTVNGNAVFNKALNISNTFNNENVATLSSVFWLSDMDNTVASVTNMNDVHIASNAHVLMKGMINGEDFSTLAENVLKNKCSTQQVTASWSLDKLETSSLQADTVTNTLKDSDVFKLENILRTDKTQTITGSKSFPEVNVAGSVDLAGTFNGLNVKTDLVQYGKSAEITSEKTFNQKLTIKGDLAMSSGSTIQGVDVSAFEESAVLHNDSGITKPISGITTFKGLVLKDLQVGGTVDGVSVDSSTILLTTGAQTVAGLVTVSLAGEEKVVFVDQGLTVQDKKFNTISLDKLYKNSVRVDGTNDTITAEVVFLASPTFSSISLESHLVNGYNLTDLVLFLGGKHTLENMGNLLQEAIEASEDSNIVLEERPTDLWYFHETSFSQKLHKLQPVTLSSSLGHNSVDTLVGLNWADGTINVYGPEVGRRSLATELKDFCEEREHLNILSSFPLTSNVTIPKAMVAAGLGNNHLAACGQVLVALPYGAASNYKQIPDEMGKGTSYGHIFSLGNPIQTVASFSTSNCKDLVPFHLNNGMTCLAVLDYGTTSSVVCRTAQTEYKLLNYLGTSFAVQGAAVTMGTKTYLAVLEDSLRFSSSLKIFRYDSGTNKMVLEIDHDLQKASHLDALMSNSEAYIAVTHSTSPVAQGSVDIFTLHDKSGSIKMEKMQTLKAPGAMLSNFGELAKYNLGLFVQTKRSIQMFALKGMQFVFEREVMTMPAQQPSSFPFYHTGQNTTILLYAGSDLEGAYAEASATAFEAVYRP